MPCRPVRSVATPAGPRRPCPAARRRRSPPARGCPGRRKASRCATAALRRANSGRGNCQGRHARNSVRCPPGS
ncbi:hypothetical protein DRB17_04535 [Ferruginivarius sediminum]|uniref:Uncharacterized protein n=1 Tax=Ferruginivarius sediminum TaxID=2661937 RepID=A0A369TF89_9PROT|nr:hypothetical protein DRB17_04535 [Ferruginivarius sediminum]